MLPKPATDRLARQHGCVSRSELRASGFPERRIDGWLERGELITLHRRVYASPAAPNTRQRAFWAATRSTDPPGVISHRTCAGLHGCQRFDADLPIEVSVVRERRP